MAVAAAERQLAAPVFSHESAAAVWGLPVVAGAPGVHVLGPVAVDGSRRGLGTRGDVTRHAARADVQVVERDGVRVTGALDTVLAIEAARDLRGSLPVADAAIRAGLVTADELCAATTARSGARAVRRLRVVAGLADGRPESAGESVSRARIHLDGFVQPGLQVPMVRRGALVARVDFWWGDVRVAGSSTAARSTGSRASTTGARSRIASGRRSAARTPCARRVSGSCGGRGRRRGTPGRSPGCSAPRACPAPEPHPIVATPADREGGGATIGWVPGPGSASARPNPASLRAGRDHAGVMHVRLDLSGPGWHTRQVARRRGCLRACARMPRRAGTGRVRVQLTARGHPASDSSPNERPRPGRRAPCAPGRDRR